MQASYNGECPIAQGSALIVPQGDWQLVHTCCDVNQIKDKYWHLVPHSSWLVLCAQACMQSVGYQAARSRPCSTFQCFSSADCTNHGSCNASTGACSCSAGYIGPSCNVFKGPCPSPSPTPSPQPPAVNTHQTFCCPTGVVDYVGKCCQSGMLSLLSSSCNG